tara:strand:- start:64 stop:1440 length:1377 start_codon:yes stop_codon:yes gene_type:complete
LEPFASPDHLDPKLREFLEEACERLCGWFAETSSLTPLPDLSNYPDIEIPIKGLSSEGLLADLEILMGGAYRPSHPGALAHLDPPPLTSSIVADLISAGLNNNLLATELSPSFSRLEKKLCSWFACRIGMPPQAGGVLASGGSITNLMALVVARHSAGLRDDPSAVVLASADSHISLSKSVGVMGLNYDSLQHVATNPQGQISIDALEESLINLQRKGRKCFAVVATAGTTVRGSIDSIVQLSQFCLREGLWLHVDGAIGGVFALVKSTSHLLKGISLADSVSLNPQKLLGVAKTSSVLLVANKKNLTSAFGFGMPYVEPSVADNPHGGECGLQGTRSADVLKLWLGLRQLGEEGIQSLLDNAIKRRVYLQQLLDCSKLDIASGPLHLIACTPKSANNSTALKWSVSTREFLLDKHFMLSRPLYRGKYYLKAVLGNPHTQSSHLEKLSRFLNDSINII